MEYKGYTTFNTEKKDGVLYVTIDYPPVNVQGQAMLADLNSLAMRLERDRETKVVVFQSAHPEIWVCHYDTELLKDMSTQAVSRDEKWATRWVTNENQDGPVYEARQLLNRMAECAWHCGDPGVQHCLFDCSGFTGCRIKF